MLNVAICDDEIPATGKMDMFLQKIANDIKVDIDTDVFWDGENLVNAIVENRNRYDIIYLDIEMKRVNGISAAKRIREYDKNVLIIFATSHSNYMKSTFEVRPFRFLTKPLEEREFLRCFKEAFNEIQECDQYFRYKFNRINQKVLVRDILFFESQKRKVKIITETKELDMYGKLSGIEKSLCNCKIPFLRVHQSYLVNYKHILGQGYDYVIMSNNKKISISEERRKEVSEAYGSMEGIFYVEH